MTLGGFKRRNRINGVWDTIAHHLCRGGFGISGNIQVQTLAKVLALYLYTLLFCLSSLLERYQLLFAMLSRHFL